jgi:hypothetical protein
MGAVEEEVEQALGGGGSRHGGNGKRAQSCDQDAANEA